MAHERRSRRRVLVESPNATANQIAGLAKFGIIAPPTKKACSTLLTWISNGGDRSDERVAIIKSTQNRFHNKRVRHRSTGATGVVQYIYWRPLGVKAALHSLGHPRFNHPLDAYVEWDSEFKGASRPTSIGRLEPI